MFISANISISIYNSVKNVQIHDANMFFAVDPVRGTRQRPRGAGTWGNAPLGHLPECRSNGATNPNNCYLFDFFQR